MHSIHLHSVRTQRRTEGEMPAAMRRNWARNRSTDGGTAATKRTGQGAWLRATPGNTAYTIANEAFRFNIGHRLGLDAPGAGQGCRRALRLGQGPTCQGHSDILRHTNRHRLDELRDHLAQHARSSGVTATIWCTSPRPTHAHRRRAHDGHGSQHHLDRRYGHGGPANQARHGEPQGRGQRIWARRSEPSRDTSRPGPFCHWAAWAPGALRSGSRWLSHLQEGQAHGEHLGAGHGGGQKTGGAELLDHCLLHAGPCGLQKPCWMPGIQSTWSPGDRCSEPGWDVRSGVGSFGSWPKVAWTDSLSAGERERERYSERGREREREADRERERDKKRENKERESERKSEIANESDKDKNREWERERERCWKEETRKGDRGMKTKDERLSSEFN